MDQATAPAIPLGGGRQRLLHAVQFAKRGLESPPHLFLFKIPDAHQTAQ
jgi:hypothetical protein